MPLANLLVAQPENTEAMVEGRLTKDTLVPLGLAVSVVAAIAIGAVWLNYQLQNLNFQMSALQIKVDTIQSQLVEASNLHWSARDMRLWIALLQAKNPNMEIPDVSK